MLQRKQTLFLLLAAISAGLTYLFPVATYLRHGQSFVFRTYGVFTGQGVPVADAAMRVPFAIVIGLVCALLLTVIFLYRNRPRQLRLTRLAALLMVAVGAFFFITDRSLLTYLEQGGEVAREYGVSIGLPTLSIVFCAMALRGIKRDEELVRSMDRLR